MENHLNNFARELGILLSMEITLEQVLMGIMALGLLVIVVLFLKVIVKSHKYNILKKRVLNDEIQVITVKGKRGKEKKVIKTKDQLRNPAHNKTIRTPERTNSRKNVTHIRED